eukprot:scaffold840_cov344-Pavlova_lutheri.AAC.132
MQDSPCTCMESLFLAPSDASRLPGSHGLPLAHGSLGGRVEDDAIEYTVTDDTSTCRYLLRAFAIMVPKVGHAYCAPSHVSWHDILPQ